MGLEDRDVVSRLSQLNGACEPCGPSSYDRHLLLSRLAGLRYWDLSLSRLVVCNEPFQRADRNGLVHLSSPKALVLAGVVAYTSDDAGEGEPFPDKVKGLEKPALSNEPHVIPHVEVDGTAVDAGRCLPVYHVG
ncbi:MAG: hypothetical protein A4E64_02137 [Syntrophorhabdus sp. PtaU1.Bin058]|nr:MAG: hypothetical protein A4E64_02137 [Syntrophorhabdus sp. PtaU1.Bin058]